MMTVLTLLILAVQPALLQIRVIQGEGAVHAPGARAPGFTVQVADEIGQPVAGATVSFLLPNDGPSGVFAGGLLSEVAQTGADGRVTTSPIRWNRIAGPAQVRVLAALGDLRAGTMIAVELSDAGSAARPAAQNPRVEPSRKRTRWVVLAIAAGAAGVAFTAGRTAGSGTRPSDSVQIGTPTITIR